MTQVTLTRKIFVNGNDTLHAERFLKARRPLAQKPRVDKLIPLIQKPF